MITEEEKKVLQGIPTHRLIEYLREERHRALISWSVDDVMGKAKNMGAEMEEEDAKKIIADLNRTRNCEFGITWDHVETAILFWRKQR